MARTSTRGSKKTEKTVRGVRGVGQVRVAQVSAVEEEKPKTSRRGRGKAKDDVQTQTQAQAEPIQAADPRDDDENNVEGMESNQPEKKRRGRPPGSKNKSSGMVAQVSAQPTATGRTLGSSIRMMGVSSITSPSFRRKDMDIRFIESLRPALDLNPSYQRPSGAWNTKRQRALLYSILCGWVDIPKIYLRQITTPQGDIYEVVDGKQRLSTIFAFLDNRLTLGDEIPEIAGMKFESRNPEKALPAHWKSKFLNAPLDVVVLENYDEPHVREMFRVLQQGVPTNAQEYRNALVGDVRDAVQEISQHPIFTAKDAKGKSKGFVQFSNNRLGHQQVGSQLLAISLNNNEPADIGKPALDRIYRDYQNGQPEAVNRALQATLNVLDFLATGLDAGADENFQIPKGVLTKGQFITMFSVACWTLKHKQVKDTPEEFIDAYFEVYNDYMAKRGDGKDADYLTFDNNVGGGSDSAQAIETRRDIFLRKMNDFIETLGDAEIDDLSELELEVSAEGATAPTENEQEDDSGTDELPDALQEQEEADAPTAQA